MKFSIYLLFLSMTIGLAACGGESANAQATERRAPTGPADITIEAAGQNGGTAFLIGTFADQRFKVDSTQVEPNGRTQFKRTSPYDPGFYFVLFPDQSALQLLIDYDQTFTVKVNMNDVPNSVVVDGSLDNELLYSTMRFEQDLQPQINAASQQVRALSEGDPNYAQAKNELDALVAQRKTRLEEVFNENPNSFFTVFKKAGQNPDIKDIRLPNGTVDQAAQVAAYRQEFWDDVDFSDDRLIRTPVIANKLNRYMTELTPQHPDSIKQAASLLVDRTLDAPEYLKFFANWIALQYEPTKTSLMDSEAVYVHMVQNYFTYERAFWSDSANVYALQLRAHEMAASLIGQPGPDVTAPGPDGQMHSITDLDAPYVIVYLYNPTCEHCMVETPKLVDFYREWKDKGVDVYSIAVDTDDQEWKDYIAKTGMSWTNVFDPTNRSIYAKYYVDVTPEIYVLNADRIIIAKNLKVDQIAEVIQREEAKR